MANGERMLDQQITQLGGVLPLLMGKSSPLPIETVYQELQPFDEKAYVTGIADFIVKNSPLYKSIDYPKTIDEVMTAYKEHDKFGAVFKMLYPILQDYNERGVFQIVNVAQDEHWSLVEKWDAASALKLLSSYGGCPPLYLFHKTAHAALPRGNFQNDNTVLGNPLIQKEVYLTNWFKLALAYLDRPEKFQYVIAFPMKEISDAQRRLYEWDSFSFGIRRSSLGYLEQTITKIDFSEFSERELSAILKNTKVFLPKMVNQISKD